MLCTNWSVKLEQSGDWHDRKQPGSKSKLTRDQKEKLKRIIDSGPRSYGYDTDLWTLKRISEVISREYNVDYNTTHIWRVLKNLGYSA
ncbi:winged helix-turn-helix domain-containing protein [Cuniculiplasma sp. SKW3]|uniref:winged helix-turn-helix domain-containing protein n=1 Tax=Cuniculiplasma sp. SKW3 TaxID=3400170 RepID=UPI003FD44991